MQTHNVSFFCVSMTVVMFADLIKVAKMFFRVFSLLMRHRRG